MTWLTAAQALALLGTKPQTLYANVSRGRIRGKPDPKNPRRSLYHGDDVERLAERHRGRERAETVAAGTINWGEPILASAISTIVAGRLYYRGHDAVQRAQSATLEDVAGLLWDAPGIAFDNPAPAVGPSPLPPSLRRAFIALAAHASADPPSRGRAASILRAEATGLVALMTEALVGAADTTMPLHRRYALAWHRPDAADGIRRALVLLADHELNASAFAARIAASTGASLAACILVGLATLSGPLHGGAGASVAALVLAARLSSADDAIAALLAQGRQVPGFGHTLYPDGDARAIALMESFTMPPLFAELRAAALRLIGEEPNIDFALAAFAAGRHLPADAPLILFAQARAVGWIAHALEQGATGELIRPRARYRGPAPLIA